MTSLERREELEVTQQLQEDVRVLMVEMEEPRRVDGMGECLAASQCHNEGQ